MGPYGVFSPDREQGFGYVLLGGGIGITPLYSMCLTMADRGDVRPVFLFYGGRALDELTFHDDMDQLAGALIIVPAASGRRLAGSLSAMLQITVTISVTSTLIGTWIGLYLHRQTGPLIVLVATGIFLLSLLPLPFSALRRGQMTASR